MQLISTFNQEIAKKDSVYKDTLLSNFNTFYLIGPGFHWPGRDDLRDYERGVDFLLNEGKSIIGHCLIPNGAGYRKVKELELVSSSSNDLEYKKDSIKKYLVNTITRFDGKIKIWYLFNEISSSTCIAENCFGHDFIPEIEVFCRNEFPLIDFRVNEYGFQDKKLLDALVRKTSGSRSLGIGIQIYTTGKNPFFKSKLKSRISYLREKLPGKKIYFSEVAVLNKNKVIINKTYQNILDVATSEGISEVGFWWPTNKYTESCWETNSLPGLWDEKLNPTSVYNLFF